MYEIEMELGKLQGTALRLDIAPGDLIRLGRELGQVVNGETVHVKLGTTHITVTPDGERLHLRLRTPALTLMGRVSYTVISNLVQLAIDEKRSIDELDSQPDG
jgi:hypothetical protein